MTVATLNEMQPLTQEGSINQIEATGSYNYITMHGRALLAFPMQPDAVLEDRADRVGSCKAMLQLDALALSTFRRLPP